MKSALVVEERALDRAGEILQPYARDGRIVVVTDANVRAAQGERLATGLSGGIEPDWIILEPGEASKDWPHLIRLTDELLARGVERGDHIVAFGGGVVGDLAGFAASILKRGCGLVQVPTSLLAMVDGAIGGKTGINTDAGKNQVGTFHQPSLILCDPSCLATLPDRHLRAGYAELVKYGLIGDPAFFAWCEEHGGAVLAGDSEARLHAMRTCIATKTAIVAEDERDTGGRRALLNLGHSFAHALEAESGFSDALLHGEAVAIGLALAFRLSAARRLCAPEDAVRVEQHLRAAGLPIRPADVGITASGNALTMLMRADKKATGGRLPLILVRGMGQTFVDGTVPLEEVARFLDDLPNG